MAPGSLWLILHMGGHFLKNFAKNFEKAYS